MTRSLRLTTLVFAAVLMVLGLSSLSPGRPAGAARVDVVPDSYIVKFKPGTNARVKANSKARAYGLQVRHIYESTFPGFSGTIPPGQLKKLQNDPDVLSIAADRRVSAFDDKRPLGIRRIQADRNATSQIGTDTNPISVDVAVIDTGIDPTHPDLNVVGGVSCVPGSPSYADENGHGTHVAGTIGALDNGIGVVGVAPGARLWAVRVLDANGEGQFSDVICGVDWVTAHVGTVKVANMSLGGEEVVDSCTGGSLHEAICDSVAAGVTYVVAAGNSSADASGFVPAAYPEVITVSAIVDTDGLSGGRGTSTIIYGDDDELAGFSNFGAPVDIAAPGYNIYSTWPSGTYTYQSGTSMASPHVAGAAAIYLYLHPGASPATVRADLISGAWAQGSADGFTGDVDGFAEPLVNAGAIGGPPLPPPTPACTLDVSGGIVGSSAQVSCVNFGANEFVRIYWDSTSTTQRAAFFSDSEGGGTAKVTIPDATGGVHQIIARGSNSGIELSMPFTVNAAINPASTSGKVGAFLSVKLSGFPASVPTTIKFDDAAVLATGTTSATGTTTIFVTIPESTAGNHTLSASSDSSGGSGTTVTAAYRVIPGVSLSLGSGTPGSSTTVNLRGFAAGESIVVTWQDSATAKSQVAQVTASALGSATVSLTIPSASRGAHLIEGIGGTGNQGSATFTVTPSFSTSTTSGVVGTNLIATLRGYTAGEAVTIKWYDTTTAAITLTSVTISAAGEGSATFAIPDATSGFHRLEAVGSASGTKYVSILVKQNLVPAPLSGEAGSTVIATATGFGPTETITVRWFTTFSASITAATGTSSDKGGASISFVVPSDATVGNHKVDATGSTSGARISATFTVTQSGPTPSPDPACSFTPSAGPVGTKVSVTCSNFAVNENIRLYWDDAATTYKAAIWSGSAGGGTATFPVPDSVAGPHKVIAVGSTSGLKVESAFAVTPAIKLSSPSVKVGTTILATLSGFSASETVTVTWDGGTAIKVATVGATGGASVTFAIPESPRGDHTVTATGGASGMSASATATVIPGISMSPPVGATGRPSTVTLRGYGPGEAITMVWHDSGAATVTLGTAAASASGSASATVTIPESVRGDHPVDGVGSGGGFATVNFTVTSSFAVSPTSGIIGTPLNLTATGFAANESISVQWFETTTQANTIATLTASDKGTAAATVAIPESVNGIHKLQVTGVTSGAYAYQFITVKPSLVLNPVSGASGATVTVTLTGYRAGETVKIAWFATTTSSSVIASAVASNLGSASATFAVPAGATTGDHKVEGTGQSSSARASATFSVSQPTSVSTPAIQSLPTVDVPITDDFSGNGVMPTGWSVATGSGAVTIDQHGNAVHMTAGAGSGSAWLVRDGSVYSRATVQVRLRVNRGAAGVVLAWNGPTNYVAVVANSDTGRLEVVEVVDGAVRQSLRTDDGGVPVRSGRDYWLRAESGVAGGDAWVNLYWSSNGVDYVPVGMINGLINVAGGVGLTGGGQGPLKVELDDFSASLSSSAGPLQIAPKEPIPATATPTPMAQPTVETAPEPTAPPETPTATPEPTLAPPTLEPTLEPPVEQATPEG